MSSTNNRPVPSPQACARNRQRRGGGQSDRDAHRRVQRTGDHDGNVDLCGDRQQRRNTAQRSNFQHRDVGRAGADHSQRVAGLANALVGGDRHVDLTTHLRQLVDRRAGLLEVLQRAEGGRRFNGLCDGPGPVGVDPHSRHQRAHRVHPGDVVVEGLTGLGDLHLRRPCTGEAGEDLGNLRSGHGRDGGIDVDPHPSRRRGCPVGRVERGGEPVRGLGVAVFEECAEFAPTRRALDQRHLAGGDAAEAHPHRQGHDVQALENVVDGQHGSGDDDICRGHGRKA